MKAIIRHLYIYPIKSCAAVELKSMSFDTLGAVRDRRYMLVDDTGTFISQRRFPELCLVKCRNELHSWCVELPNLKSKRLAFIGEKTKKLSVKIWKDNVEAFDQGDNWAQFFSRYLSCSVRLVYIDATCLRYVDEQYAQHQEQVSFADGFPLLIANQASLDDIVSEHDSALEMLRFRPNIVVEGIPAWIEDTQPSFYTEHLQFDLLKPCSRCVIPSINPFTGEKQSAVLQRLVQKLRADDGQIYFGQNAVVKGSGVLSTGNVLQVGKC